MSPRSPPAGGDADQARRGAGTASMRVSERLSFCASGAGSRTAKCERALQLSQSGRRGRRCSGRRRRSARALEDAQLRPTLNWCGLSASCRTAFSGSRRETAAARSLPGSIPSQFPRSRSGRTPQRRSRQRVACLAGDNSRSAARTAAPSDLAPGPFFGGLGYQAREWSRLPDPADLQRRARRPVEDAPKRPLREAAAARR